MRWPRIIFLSVLFLIAGAFLHYVLPQRDVVRIVSTESLLTDVQGWNSVFYSSPDSGTSGTQAARDVRFINTVQTNGRVMTYRNEDTGLVWPPYFKFDSQDLQTEATNLLSTADDPRWVAITHYGWRSNWISIYPNAIGVTSVDGPDVTLVPWPAIAIMVLLALILFMAWRIWERFEDRVIDPARDRSAVWWAKMRDWLAGRR